jgi:glutamine amidotransferase
MIGVVDYGRGNLFGLAQGLAQLGVEHVVTPKAQDLFASNGVILPGVGAFADAMAALHERQLVEPLREIVNRGVPLLGICLGMQVFARAGEEFGAHEGLGFLAGTARRLPGPRPGDPAAVRIPNVGWRPLVIKRHDPLTAHLTLRDMVYFVHSYALFAEHPEDVVSVISINGLEVPAVVRRGNIVGCQFHPEKSGPVGLSLLERFVAACQESKNLKKSRPRASPRLSDMVRNDA